MFEGQDNLSINCRVVGESSLHNFIPGIKTDLWLGAEPGQGKDNSNGTVKSLPVSSLWALLLPVYWRGFAQRQESSCMWLCSVTPFSASSLISATQQRPCSPGPGPSPSLLLLRPSPPDPANDHPQTHQLPHQFFRLQVLASSVPVPGTHWSPQQNMKSLLWIRYVTRTGMRDNQMDIVPDLREHPSYGMVAALPRLLLIWKTLTTQGSALGPTLHLWSHPWSAPPTPPFPGGMASVSFALSLCLGHNCHWLTLVTVLCSFTFSSLD